MKENRLQHRSRGGIWVTLGVVAVVAAAVALAIGYSQLRALYLEQCVITDLSEQVEIMSGKMIKPDVIAYEFGLRKGANLAEIDFEEKREEILRKIPTLRAISVTRHLPGRVVIRAEERTPVVRLGVSGPRGASDRVADAEGVVFNCVRGTRSLPLVREAPGRGPATPPGRRLKGRARAALDLVLLCRESDYADLVLLDVDTAKTDFLVATLGDYSRVKICWDGMDDATPASRAALAARLGLLAKALRANCDGLKARVWNATLPDYVFADTQEKP